MSCKRKSSDDIDYSVVKKKNLKVKIRDKKYKLIPIDKSSKGCEFYRLTVDDDSEINGNYTYCGWEWVSPQIFPQIFSNYELGDEIQEYSRCHECKRFLEMTFVHNIHTPNGIEDYECPLGCDIGGEITFYCTTKGCSRRSRIRK